MRNNYDFLTTAPVEKVISTMAVPTILSMLVTSIYNIVDTYFVGQLNTQATAAVGIAFPIMSIIQAVGFFFGQGSGTFISRELGAKELRPAQQMASTAFFSAFAFGLLITILGLVFLQPLSVMMGSTPTILPYSMRYLGIILLGAPIMTCSMVLNNQMRFQGNALKAMYGMMTGAALNVVLVPLFTFTFGMGITGTAIGTVLSQLFGFVVLLIMSRQPDNISIRLSNFALRSDKGNIAKEILRGGTPSLTRQGLACISTALLNVAAGHYGDAAIAGMSIVTRITFLIFAVIIGIGHGFQPLCGFNYGARLFKRVRAGYMFSVKLSVAFLLLCCVPAFIFAENVVDVLRHDPEVVKVGAAALRWQLLTLPFAAVITISNMALQTSGRSLSANLLAASRNGIFFIPTIIILPHLCGLLGVEIAQTVSDTLSFMLCVPLIYSYFKSIATK